MSLVKIKEGFADSDRPIGVVGGSVNKPGQTAAEIVEEIVQETVVALNSAALFVNPASKL